MKKFFNLQQINIYLKIFYKKYFNSIIFLLFLFFTAIISRFLTQKNHLFMSFSIVAFLIIIIFLCKDEFKKIKANSFIKILFWLLLISIFLGSSFLAIPVGSYHIILFRILLFLTLLFIIYQILLNRGKIKISYKKINFYLLFFAIWFLYALITISWTISKTESIKELFFLFSGFNIIFLMVFYLKKIRDFKTLYILWLILFGFLTGLGLWEMFTGNRLPSSGYFETKWANKMIWPTAIFHNTNDFASFIAFARFSALSTGRFNT